jgi:hypothetical protein
MAKALSPDALEELRQLLDSIDRTLAESNYQTLSRAQVGSRLSPTNCVQLVLDSELKQIKRIRELLGLPSRGKRIERDAAAVPPDSNDEPLREQLVKQGIEPVTYRNVRLVRERRIAARKKNPGAA